jgi:putative nucleotidyltransferase with HDIG domain
MTPRQRSEVFRLGVGLAALGVLAPNFGRLAGGGFDWWLIGSLAVAGILALAFPLQINLSTKMSVASAVFFAAVLLLPMWQAAALVALLQAMDVCRAAARRMRATREKPPLRAIGLSLLFNGGQAYLSALAAGLVLASGGVSASGGLRGSAGDLALIGAAGAMYAVNIGLVSTAVALGTSRSPLAHVRNTHLTLLFQSACLYVLGAAAAFASVRYAWLPLLGIVPAVLVYHSLRQRIEMRQEAMRAMERMADEVDRRDPYTFHHSQRVAIYAHAIARRLGMGPSEIELLEVAAKVHDIGKIRIPDSILLKPAKLTADERRVMETHPRLGFDILRAFSEYEKVLDLVLTHHERYDGHGYPNGAVGRRLLLIAQIIPVADSLDAMTTARAYRPARTWDAALEELRRGAGTQWNPHVVEAASSALVQATVAPGQTRLRASRPAPGTPAAAVPPSRSPALPGVSEAS